MLWRLIFQPILLLLDPDYFKVVLDSKCMQVMPGQIFKRQKHKKVIRQPTWKQIGVVNYPKPVNFIGHDADVFFRHETTHVAKLLSLAPSFKRLHFPLQQAENLHCTSTFNEKQYCQPD